MSGGTHVVYIMRDANADPLYVGMTNNIDKRLAAHRQDKPWFCDVTTVATSLPMARQIAMTTERRAIIELEPRHNVRFDAPREPVSTITADHIGCAAAAQILGCSTATVKRLAKSGILPAAFKMDGQTGAYVFARSTVEALASERAA